MNTEIMKVTALVCGNRIVIIETESGKVLNYVRTGHELARFCNENACKLTNRESFTKIVTDLLNR
jgi:hypothetical protein